MQHGAQIHVLMLPDSRTNNPYQELLARALEQEGVAVEFPQGYRRILPITRAVMDCRHRPDVIHLHWLSRYARGGNLLTAFLYRAQLLLDLSLARMLGPRLVWTIHNLMPHECRWPRLDSWLRRSVIRLTDRAIVHSQGAQAEFCREYSCRPEKIAIIPHGHYRDFYGSPLERCRAREMLSLPQDCRLFLFFGMIRPYKGVDRLLSLWKTSPHDAMLLVAGKPKNEAMREQVSAQGQQPDVRLMLRRIDDREIPLLFSAADVAVFPFRDSLTSGSVALAMSYDVPVIAPRLPGIAGILEGADDLLYDPNQADGLKQAVLKSGGMELQPLRERTRHACDRLSWQLIARRTNDCYKIATEQ